MIVISERVVHLWPLANLHPVTPKRGCERNRNINECSSYSHTGLLGFYSMHVDNCRPCQLKVYALLCWSSSKQQALWFVRQHFPNLWDLSKLHFSSLNFSFLVINTDRGAIHSWTIYNTLLTVQSVKYTVRHPTFVDICRLWSHESNNRWLLECRLSWLEANTPSRSGFLLCGQRSLYSLAVADHPASSAALWSMQHNFGLAMSWINDMNITFCTP